MKIQNTWKCGKTTCKGRCHSNELEPISRSDRQTPTFPS